MGFEFKQTPTGGVQLWDDASGAQAAIVQCLNWTANRAPTNTTIVGTLPANARILRIDVVVPIASNAATTATVSVGLAGGSATAFTAAQDVKTAIGTFSQTATAAWALSGGSQTVNCTYTETGTASSVGQISVAVYFAIN